MDPPINTVGWEYCLVINLLLSFRKVMDGALWEWTYVFGLYFWLSDATYCHIFDIPVMRQVEEFGFYPDLLHFLMAYNFIFSMVLILF